MGYDTELANHLQPLFQSIVFLLPMLGAFVADTWTGRFIPIVVGCIASAVGAGLGALGIAKDLHWLILTCLFLLIAAPISLVKPLCIVLGGDQFNEKNPTQLKQRRIYFGQTYWITNIGAGIAFLVFAQMQVMGMGKITPDKSFMVVFIICACLLGLAGVVMLGVSKNTFVAVPQGSAMTVFVKITVSAVRAGSKRGAIVVSGLISLILASIVSVPSIFINRSWLDYLLASIIIIACVALVVAGRDGSWVHKCKERDPNRFSEAEISGAADVYRLSPYIAMAIPFWAVYNQMNTNFVSMACQMNNEKGLYKMSPTALQFFDSFTCVLLIPLLDRLIYPCLKKACGGKFVATPMRRIGVGMFMCGIAMLGAGLMESQRKKAPVMMTTCGLDEISKGWCQAGTDPTASIPKLTTCRDFTKKEVRDKGLVPINDYSVLYQGIIYAIVAICECLVGATLYDLFYSQVPPFIRAVCQAIQFLTTSLGTLVGSEINTLAKPWLTDNLNDGHQEYAYYVNMALSWVFMLVFIWIASSFEYKPGTSEFPWDVIEEEKEPRDAISKESDSYSRSSDEEDRKH